MLIRRENAAFISPANSSVIREAERWREETRGLQRREDRQRRGGAGEVVRSTGIKQTELVPCDKNHRSRNLTGTIDFFPPPLLLTRVFSASRCLFSKRSNLRGHLRRWAAYTFYPYFFSFFSLPLPLTCFLFFSLSQFPIISARQFCFSSPGTSTLLIRRLSVCHRRGETSCVCLLSLSLSFSDCSRWRFVVLFPPPPPSSI